MDARIQDPPIIVAEVVAESPYPVSMGPENQDAFVDLSHLPSLTKEENTFALAIIEYGGNVARAVRAAFDDEDIKFPVAMGHELLQRPQVAAQIARLQVAAKEEMLISAGSHLEELARIRDLAIVTGNIKVAAHVEISRGQVAGFYQRHDKGKGAATNAVQININMASKHDENI